MGQQRKNTIGTDPEELLKVEEEATKAKEDQAKAKKFATKISKIKKTKEESEKASVVEEETTETTEPKKELVKKTKPVKSKRNKTKTRSAQYLKAKTLVSLHKLALSEAVKKVKETSYTKFDGTIELHIKLAKPKKAENPLRQLVDLPGGLVKAKKIAVLDDKVIAELEKGKADFDILVATPEEMPKIAKYARILGPRGLMPSPKSGTVVTDTKKAVAELSGGKVEIRQDSLGNIHLGLGKVSWDDEKIISNAKAVISTIPVAKIVSITICATMGPGVAVALDKK